MSRNAAHATNADRGPHEETEGIGRGAPLPPVVRFEAVSGPDGGDGAALRGLSFALPPGSFYVLTGKPGSGKTRLLNLIQAAAPPARGRIELFGRDVAGLRRKDRALTRGRIGMLAMEPRFVDHLPVFDNAALGPRLAGRKPQSYRDEVAQLLAWVGLTKRMGDPPGDLSAGERRRLALGRALANGPAVLLVDEPADDVDAATEDRVLRLLGELNGAGITLLIATGDENLAFRLEQPVMRLQAGRLTRIDDAAQGAAWGEPP